MRQLLIFLTLCVLSFDISAQEIPKNPNAYDLDGNKTGTWTILYDLDWNVTESIDSAECYQIITYENGKPKGKVTIYYITGEKIWEGFLLSDDPEEIMDGKCIWFSDDSLISEIKYYQNGELNGISSIYNNQEEICLDVEYKDGYPINYEVRIEDKATIDGLADLALDFWFGFADINTASEISTRNLEIIKNVYGEKDTTYLSALDNLIGIYHEMGAYHMCLESSLKHIKLVEEIYGVENEAYIRSLANLIMIYGSLGDHNKAIDIALECIDKLEGLEIDSSLFARILHNLSMNYSYLENHEKALETHLASHDLIIDVYGKDSYEYFQSLQQLGIFYDYVGESEKVLDLYNESIKILEELYGPLGVNPMADLDHAAVMNNIASYYLDRGDYSKSLEKFNAVLKIKERLLGDNHPDYLITIGNICVNYLGLKDYETAIQYASEYQEKYTLRFKLYERSLNNDLTEELYDILFEEFEFGFIFAKKINDFEQMKNQYNNFAFLKGRELSNTSSVASSIYKSNDNILIKSYEDWISINKEISNAFEISLAKKKELGIDLSKLQEKADKLERHLIKSSNIFASNQRDYSFDEIVSNLQDDDVYFDIVNIPTYNFDKAVLETDSNRYYAYVIKKGDRVPRLVDLGYTSDFDGAYNYYSNYTQERPSNKEFSNGNIVLGNICYQNFWSKLEPYLEGVSNVYFSPEGVYSKINLNVLYDSTSSSFLMDKYNIVYVSNVEDFVHQKENIKLYERPDNLNAVLIGNPTFLLDKDEVVLASNESQSRSINQDELDSSQRGMLLSDLPGTQTEVDLISDNLKSKSWDVEVITGIDATETRVKSIEAPKILHIATHGFFFEDQEMVKRSNIISTDNKKAIANPMTRSGLIFSGAENTMNGEILAGNNGWLNSYEASLLNLRGTELVVLSACKTAAGDVQNGKGVYGLQRAIRVAGAESLIMSMWEVDDKATQELMTYFYDYWIDKKMTKKGAFNKAQQKIREKYKHPYYWGAFIMLGE